MYVIGVPLSNYTVLKFLADGIEKNRREQRSLEMELALDALDNYSVFAFILHDPKVHTNFHDFFQKQFKSLHYSSGEHLVFFGLVDTPENYRLIGRRAFYTDIRDMVELYENEHQDLNDSSYEAFAIANSLNIQPDMLPAIIVTHDTRLRSYRWYKTCPDKIETQMNRLTGISYEMNSYKTNDKISLVEKQKYLYELLDEVDIDLCKGMGTTELNESMARALSDIMTFLIEIENQENRSDRVIQRFASKEQRIALNRMTAILKYWSSKLNIVDIDDLESNHLFPIIQDLNIKLATCLSILNKKFQTQYSTPTFVNPEWLEPHSFNLYQTGVDVHSFLQSRNNEKEQDYSASAICFAKMFEQEINYSFSHWVRKNHSIDLPDYFNKYQPGLKAVERAHFRSGELGTPVDFNRRSRNGTWQPPELGKTKLIAETNITANGWKTMGISNPKALLSEWNKIYQVRNKAAHTEKVSIDEIISIQDSLAQLSKSNIIKELAELKSSFKPNLAL